MVGRTKPATGITDSGVAAPVQPVSFGVLRKLLAGPEIPDKPKGFWVTNLPWMQIFIGDELAETSHLSAEEYGAHMLLRLHQWKHENLPTDEDRLRRICRVDADRWASIRDALAPLFDWQWHHQRTADVRKESETKHANLSANGKKGGRPPKKTKADENPMESQGFDRVKADGKQSQSQSQSQSPSYSDSHSASETHAQSPDWALDKKEKEKMTTPFPQPATIEEGRKALVGRGVPQTEIERCLRMLMAGHLTPYDIEDWDVMRRATA